MWAIWLGMPLLSLYVGWFLCGLSSICILFPPSLSFIFQDSTVFVPDFKNNCLWYTSFSSRSTWSSLFHEVILSPLNPYHTSSGWWFQLLWKIWTSIGMTIPNIRKNKNTCSSHHQPVICYPSIHASHLKCSKIPRRPQAADFFGWQHAFGSSTCSPTQHRQPRRRKLGCGLP